MGNVIPIPNRHSVHRILEKIIAGQPLNPAEKALLRWAATQPRGYPLHQPEQENRNREPAA